MNTNIYTNNKNDSITSYINSHDNTILKKNIDFHEPYYSENNITKNIKLISDKTLEFNLRSNATYIDNILLKVNIPYFFLKKIKTTTVETIATNKIYSSILFNNFKTYLVKINSIYYLIPNFNLDIYDYKLKKIKYIDIKDYI